VASGAQGQKATNDAVATGVGVAVFWPALFFIKGDAASAQKIAQLKGNADGSLETRAWHSASMSIRS